MYCLYNCKIQAAAMTSIGIWGQTYNNSVGCFQNKILLRVAHIAQTCPSAYCVPASSDISAKHFPPSPSPSLLPPPSSHLPAENLAGSSSRVCGFSRWSYLAFSKIVLLRLFLRLRNGPWGVMFISQPPSLSLSPLPHMKLQEPRTKLSLGDDDCPHHRSTWCRKLPQCSRDLA